MIPHRPMRRSPVPGRAFRGNGVISVWNPAGFQVTGFRGPGNKGQRWALDGLLDTQPFGCGSDRVCAAGCCGGLLLVTWLLLLVDGSPPLPFFLSFFRGRRKMRRVTLTSILPAAGAGFTDCLP